MPSVRWNGPVSSPLNLPFPISRSYRSHIRSLDIYWTYYPTAEQAVSFGECIPTFTETPINESDEIIDQSHVNMHGRLRARASTNRIIATRDLGHRFCFHLCDNYVSHRTVDLSHLRYERTGGNTKLTRTAAPPMNGVTSAVTAAQWYYRW